MLLGLVGAARLGGLRWVIGTACCSACSSSSPPRRPTRSPAPIASIWWDDSWRLVGLAALPMAVLVGNGVAEVQRLVAAGLVGGRRFVGLATAAGVLLAFVLGTRMLYLERDQQRMAQNTGDDGPAVSWLEVQGMLAIAADRAAGRAGDERPRRRLGVDVPAHRDQAGRGPLRRPAARPGRHAARRAVQPVPARSGGARRGRRSSTSTTSSSTRASCAAGPPVSRG